MVHPIHSDSYRLLSLLLLERRQELGLLQVDVAHLLNKPQSFVSKYESADRRLDMIELLAVLRVLDVDPHHFLDQLIGKIDAERIDVNPLR